MTQAASSMITGNHRAGGGVTDSRSVLWSIIVEAFVKEGGMHTASHADMDTNKVFPSDCNKQIACHN